MEAKDSRIKIINEIIAGVKVEFITSILSLEKVELVTSKALSTEAFIKFIFIPCLCFLYFLRSAQK